VLFGSNCSRLKSSTLISISSSTAFLIKVNPVSSWDLRLETVLHLSQRAKNLNYSDTSQVHEAQIPQPQQFTRMIIVSHTKVFRCQASFG
jgi:hypothetical protein